MVAYYFEQVKNLVGILTTLSKSNKTFAQAVQDNL